MLAPDRLFVRPVHAVTPRPVRNGPRDGGTAILDPELPTAEASDASESVVTE